MQRAQPALSSYGTFAGIPATSELLPCSPRSAVSKKRARHADVRMWNGWNGWPSRWRAGDRSNVRKPAKHCVILCGMVSCVDFFRVTTGQRWPAEHRLETGHHGFERFDAPRSVRELLQCDATHD